MEPYFFHLHSKQKNGPPFDTSLRGAGATVIIMIQQESQ